jgi:hypothetical protein
VRGRAADRVNRGRLDPKDVYGWDDAMRRIVERSRQLAAGPGGWGRFGFYTTGQLFLEEYYTLALIGKAGLGTPHMDGNTRLCTATSASALKASFGTDGQPASYTDVDHCDAIALLAVDPRHPRRPRSRLLVMQAAEGGCIEVTGPHAFCWLYPRSGHRRSGHSRVDPALDYARRRQQ